MRRTSVLQPCSSNIHIRNSPSFLPCCYGTGYNSTRLSQIVPNCIIGIGRLPHIAVHCCTLPYIVVHCHTLLYIAIHCCTLLYIAVHCRTLLYIVIHCHTLLYIAIIRSIYALLFPSLPYPMPCVVVSSCAPVLSLWNAKGWLYPAIERLEALVLMSTPMNFVEG